MPLDPRYASQCTYKAVQALIGAGDIRQRLRRAHSELGPIFDEDLPPDLSVKLAEIRRVLTTRPARFEGDDPVAATLYRMRDRTGERIAGMIRSLDYSLDEYLRSIDPPLPHP